MQITANSARVLHIRNISGRTGKNDKHIRNYRFWQEGNDAQQIYLNDFFEQKFNYIHQNPVKAEFVNHPEDYRYSSAIDYAGGKGLIDVTLV